jgi:hypothetical protein
VFSWRSNKNPRQFESVGGAVLPRIRECGRDTTGDFVRVVDVTDTGIVHVSTGFSSCSGTADSWAMYQSQLKAARDDAPSTRRCH